MDYSYVIDDCSNVDGELLPLYADDRRKQELHIDIDHDGTVSLLVKSYYGGDGVPMDVWHRKTLRYTVATGPVVVHLPSLRSDLEDGGRLAKLIDRIIDGHSTRWDGSNTVGCLTDDASNASQDLEHAFGRGFDYIDTSAEIWNEVEYIYDEARSLITADTTDEEIDAYLADVRESAQNNLVYLSGDAKDWLVELRNEKRFEQQSSE